MVESDNNENSQDQALESLDDNKAKQDDIDKGNWYILHVYAMYEKKVETGIMQAIKTHKLEDRVFKVIVPEQETIEVKDGKRIERMKKLFPGYVFVNMIVDDDVLGVIRRVAGVLKFIGPNNMAEPVTDDEMLKILRRMGMTKRIEVDFELGEVIKIISGPFRGYSGTINEINAEKGKLKTLISIFGREVPVELSFDQVEKGN